MTYAWTPGQAQSKPDLASDDAAGTVTEMVNKVMEAIDAGIHRHVKLTPMDCVIEAAKEAWPAFIKAALGRE
jgi:hypothetical protein|tara:strand:- start:743 stop:958 length:216 start_codon:yes stop_codon:yes gene_type:complete